MMIQFKKELEIASKEVLAIREAIRKCNLPDKLE